MLIDNLKKTYREFTGQTEQVQPVVSHTARRPAANASNFEKTEMQARRHRRQRRLERAGQYNIHGWAVRSW